MKTDTTLSFLAAGFSTLTLMSCNVQEQKPNVIFILADDLGWAQNRAYGSNYYHTPNIDRLAAEGIRFTDAYTAAAVSSPTRASIMTGKYPAKLHLTDFIPGNARDIYKLTQPDWQKFLPVEEYTLGNLFSDHGYITAMFGKWHLSREKFGPAALPNYPDKQGFYEYFVIDKPNRKTDPEHDPHCSDSIGNTSVDFIRKNKDKPFFLFMSFSAIHDPLTERSDSIAKWIKIPGTEMPENNPIIATMLSRLDRNVGQMLDILDELSLSRKTIVIFYSDNGGLAANNVVYYPDKTGLDIAKQSPLRAGKGWFYEGGIRVPLIIRWTGTIEKGRVSNEPVISCDFMPTFCELLGKKADSETLLPFELSTLKTINSFNSLNEAIDQCFGKQFSEVKGADERKAVSKKKAELNYSMLQQKEALETLSSKVELNAKKAELIYANYSKLFALTQTLNSAKDKKMQEKEIMYKMKNEFPFLKSLNLKQGKAIISLE